MYQNKRKMLVKFIVYGALFAYCAYMLGMLSLGMLLIATHQIKASGDETALYGYMLVTFLLLCALLFLQLQKLRRARKMGLYFEKDKDGLVSIEKLAVYLKMRQHKCFALFLDCVGKGLLQKCTVFSEDPTYLLLENGKNTIAEKFVVKNCKKCGAPNTFRIGFENACVYCGTSTSYLK